MIPCRSGNRGARGAEPTIFWGPLASRNPNTGNNSKPIGFQNIFDAFDKRKNNRGFEHENKLPRDESAELFHSICSSRFVLLVSEKEG
jgi:hypothetical protein